MFHRDVHFLSALNAGDQHLLIDTGILEISTMGQVSTCSTQFFTVTHGRVLGPDPMVPCLVELHRKPSMARLVVLDSDVNNRDSGRSRSNAKIHQKVQDRDSA